MSGNFRQKQCWRNLLWGVWEDRKIHEKFLSGRLQHDLWLNKNCSNWGCRFQTIWTREKTHKFSESRQETETPRVNKAQNSIIYDFLVCRILLGPADISYFNKKHCFRKLCFRRSAERTVPGRGYKRDGDERCAAKPRMKIARSANEKMAVCRSRGSHLAQKPTTRISPQHLSGFVQLCCIHRRWTMAIQLVQTNLRWLLVDDALWRPWLWQKEIRD